ncbi:uncharacterized protein LOC102305687 [Haplochromis burtoni]|uniref:uncharacterized protein LOC102305687 n=1 Tax=Haplochromis burtoni TaxID=8153 RepID=UPI001C2DC09A|nr:uncharacterized protein LOC102305687 [Haplochromis burtoni]
MLSGLSRMFFLGVTCLLMSSGYTRAETTVSPQRKPPCDSQICRLSHVQSVTCEGFQANLQCGEGQVLVIHGANYGRRDKTTCSAGRPASQLQVVQCSSQTSTNVVAESCNGKNSCTISASNSVFGDPCVGTYKYLEVDYTCQFQTVTCEESEANLQCGKGQILVIHRADYGRHDQTTCSNLQPHCRLRDVQCSSPESIEVIAASCNGKNSCNISASNSVFGNPCFGTSKYLEVDYTCQFPSATCEGSEANLQCEKGQVLVIHGANYGRRDKTTCSAGRPASQLQDVQCSSQTSTSVAAKSCNGKNSCTISASNSVFGDPCVGTYKYLEVDYTCQFPSATCEGSEANLQCEKGQVLVIHGANYGRRDKTTCSAGRPASQLQDVQCSSQTSTSVAAKSCNGKNSCTISASNSVFGDPCVGTYKYLEVDYTCQFPSATCEGSEANLQCEKGQVLVIHGANYGRRDKTTCSAGRPASQLQDVQCSSQTSTSVAAKSCNGKNSCTISASNSVFGDPCVGTYKYLEVDYTCQFPSATCEGSEANLQCEKGQVLVIHGANYGRRDKTTCSAGRPASQLQDVQCSSQTSTSVAAKSCNGKNSCTISASNSVFGDPCVGTYKYLEVDYTCQCKYLKPGLSSSKPQGPVS